MNYLKVACDNKSAIETHPALDNNRVLPRGGWLDDK